MTWARATMASVAAHNASAVHLYTSVGFVTFSREPDAFRAGDRSLEELSMDWVVPHV